MRIKEKNGKIFQFFLYFFLLSCLFVFIFSTFNLEKKKRELKAKILNLESEIKLLKEKKEKLEKEIFEAQKEEYWENLAREKGYVKEGEEAILIKNLKENEVKRERVSQEIFENLKRIFKK